MSRWIASTVLLITSDLSLEDEEEGVKGAPIDNLVGMAVMTAVQIFVQFLYRKERGRLRSIVLRLM